MAGLRQKRWDEGENVMKERKMNMGWHNDTEKLKRRDQLAVTRLRTDDLNGVVVNNADC
jgi:hypothetical protein